MAIAPWDHQLSFAESGYHILKDNMIVYLAMEERTGKSLIALLIAEKANVESILILTKKGKPLDGWKELLAQFDTAKNYYVTNYHQVSKIQRDKWDLVILDEAHNYISSFPKKSKTWMQVRTKTHETPIIYISATPHAQTYAQLYHQFALSDWSPWAGCHDYKAWHKVYGIPYTRYLYQKEVEMWDRVHDEAVIARTQHLFLTMTRKALDFKHEPVDKIHYISLSDETRALYNDVLKHKVMETDQGEILCDTITKLRTTLHMLEGGGAKKVTKVLNKKGNPVDKPEFIQLPNTEKIDYIKEHFGDTEHVAIMYNYIVEGEKLRKHFKHALILQATSYAEGVDLSYIDHLIIYSQDFSTARHTQRRARQANKHRDKPIIVHFLLVKDGISEEVYQSVSLNKVNYVDALFMRNQL